jgi:hypothetical protein
MTTFLKLKHWQLFILVIVIPLIFQFIKIGSITSYDNYGTALDNFPIIFIFGIGIYFNWLYSLGTNLFRKLPSNELLNIKAFKFFVFFPLFYFLLTSIFLFRTPSNEVPSIGMFAIMIPLQFLTLFSNFYSIYFIAKALKMVDRQKQCVFSEFAEEFFLIFFFPFGIWKIQPKINKLFENTINNK